MASPEDGLSPLRPGARPSSSREVSLSSSPSLLPLCLSLPILQCPKLLIHPSTHIRIYPYRSVRLPMRCPLPRSPFINLFSHLLTLSVHMSFLSPGHTYLPIYPSFCPSFPAHLSSHPLMQLLSTHVSTVCSVAHLSVQPYTHPPTHPPTLPPPLSRSPIRLSIDSLVLLFIHPWSHPSVLPFNHLPIYPLVQPLI